MWELRATQREAILAEMASMPLDVLVIGGGITGVGVALDAALRGLRTALVERDDFGCGTSSRSSKMVHGGLRYLATGDVRLVREALRERRSIQQRAAFLVRPLPMLLPVYGMRVPWQRMKMGTGLWVYDLLGAWRAGVRHWWMDVPDVTRALPNIGTKGLLGGLGYHDSQADDVRLVMCNLRTAMRHGALVANGAEVTRLVERKGRVTGAVVASDAAPGGEVELEASVVINAAGVWADGIFDGATQRAGFSLLPSKGIHLTVRREVAGIESGVAFFSQTGNSNVFLEPWGDDLAFIGTTDTPYSGPLASPHAEEHEVQGLLDAVNPFLRVPLRRSDVLTSWAGLRPLVADDEALSGATRSKDVSRRHRTIVVPGMVTMVGGKLTTYRQMAEDAVDAAVRMLDRSGASGDIRRARIPCTTHKVPLEGSGLVPTMKTIDQLERELGVHRDTARHLLRRYGSQCEQIANLVAADGDLRDQLHPDRPYIAAEVAYSARYEMARSASDILARRTRLAIETADQGAAAREQVESILAAHAEVSQRR